MRKIMSFAIAVVLAASGMFCNSSSTNVAGKAGKFVKSFCDDEPITLTSRVRTSGGFPISGATVSLTPSGTSTPLFTGVTDSNGQHIFDSVPQGGYHYKIVATDYYTKNVNLTFNVNTTRIDTLIAK